MPQLRVKIVIDTDQLFWWAAKHRYALLTGALGLIMLVSGLRRWARAGGW